MNQARNLLRSKYTPLILITVLLKLGHYPTSPVDYQTRPEFEAANLRTITRAETNTRMLTIGTIFGAHR